MEEKKFLQDLGLDELEKSAMSKGLRAPLSALFLLGYHTYAAQIFGKLYKREFFKLIKKFFLGNGDGDLEKAHMLVEHYLKLNPNVSND